MFRTGDGIERVQTVTALSPSGHVAEDAGHFVAHLREAGGAFADGRVVLVDLLVRFIEG